MNEDINTWTIFIAGRAPELFLRIGEHLMLTCLSTLIAILFGVCIALLAFEKRSLRNFILGTVSILQTIPSLALLVFLMTILGKIGIVPALISLVLYALLPIVRNTLTGLENVPKSVISAADGIGMTKWQQLSLVRLPLALPYMVSGIRTAAVITVGTATLATFIGAGGLGEFINRGLALSNSKLILLGAIPAAILALLADFVLGACEWGLKPNRIDGNSSEEKMVSVFKKLAIGLPVLLMLLSIALYAISHFSKDEKVRIGSKDFTEQLILGELMAQSIESHTNLKVERRFNLGGTMFCHGALLNNEIDLYPEYTGTALMVILKQPGVQDRSKALYTVSHMYKQIFRIAWLKPFGFNNTWALVVSNKNSLLQKVKNISSLKPLAATLTAGLASEFAEREDGYPGLIRAYGFRFGKVTDVDSNLSYLALVNKQLDVATGNATDGRINAYGLRILNDDQQFFPPYQAAPVVRQELLDKHPELIKVLSSFGGTIDNATMQKLNYQVDGLKESPEQVARNFLAAKDL